jgi:pyruvate dehydrogenase E1 component alpha subunit
MQTEAFSGSIDYIQIMDENGNVDPKLFPGGLDDGTIVEMYKCMLFARNLDAKTLSLQRQGRANTYAPLIGEEASQIGVAFAMRKEDVLVPSFRQHGIYLARGLSLEDYFIYWRGFEEGNKGAKSINALPVSVPVGTQMPHGAGVAFAQRYLKKDVAVFAYVGDGGTSEGDFYEALNFAGVYKLPFIAIIENNQWAISIPRSKQTAAQTLAQKAIAAGIKGVQVDGNDVVAVYKAARDAIESAREGPTVIECVTYRMSLHTTADDPTKYRDDSDVEPWKAKDPLKRVSAYLSKKGLWNPQLEQAATAEQQKQIDEAVEKAETFKPDPKSMFEHLYSFVPDTLRQEERDAVENNFWMMP